MDDARGDATDGTRWVSYAELAEARGISRRSAIRLTFRHRWARRDANDGTVRVAVPMSELERKTEAVDIAADDRDDDAGDNIRADMALEAHVATLREQLAKAEARAEAAEVQALALRAEARELVEGRAEARARAELLQAEAERLRAQVDRLTTFPGAALLDRLRADGWRRAVAWARRGR